MDWKRTLGTVAPALATALGGPLAGVATKALADGLLGDSGATEADIAAAVAGGGPDVLVRLREIDTQFKADMRRAEIDIERIHHDDRRSARERQVHVRDWTPALLAFVITLGFFGVLGWMLWQGLPQQGEQPLLVMLGSLGTAWTGIIAYYYGSSRGSDAKGETMERLLGRRTDGGPSAKAQP